MTFLWGFQDNSCQILLGLVSKSKSKVAEGGQIFWIRFLHSSSEYDAANSESSSTFSTTDEKRNSPSIKWYLQLSVYASKQDGCSVSSSADDIVSPRGTNSTAEVSGGCFLTKVFSLNIGTFGTTLSFLITI